MSAAPTRTVKAKATIAYRQGPSDKDRNAKKWREAGFAPADHIFVDFPAKLLPDIAYMHTLFLGSGGRGLMLTVTADDLTDDVQTDAELVASELDRRGSVVTRDEAAARLEKWQAKARLRAV
jgi:hypothetical protein